jgi:glutamate/tyrosine decarboxylase-like PLP-dependent enzyme
LALVRDGGALRDTFSLVPPYIRTEGNPSAVYGPPWFSEYGFQQTRAFRALKVWMALKHHGLAGYAGMIERDIALAGRLADRVRESEALELMAPPGLSVVCFRYAPPGLRGDEGRLDALNRALLERVQLGGEAFLSSTVLGGRFALRACIVNPRSTEADIDLVAGLVERVGDELRRTGPEAGA